jgi:hypothetical protein
MQIHVGNNMYLDLIGSLLIVLYVVTVAYFETTSETVNLYTINNKIDLILEKL